MIHHVSIPAKDPERVARVLAELLGGYAGPFIGPFPGAWTVYAEDGMGTGIEVYTERTRIAPGELGGVSTEGEVAGASAFHALISVKCDRETIERVGTREGWRTQHCWRPPHGVRLFEVYEMWIENRILLELVTEEMAQSYIKIANGAAQRELLAQRAAAAK